MTVRIAYDEDAAVPALAEGLRRYWREFLEVRPDERVYGVGFYDSFEHGHADVLVYTEEGLAREAADHGFDPATARWVGTPYLLNRPDLTVPPMPDGMSSEDYMRESDLHTGCVGSPGVLSSDEIDAAFDAIVGEDGDDDDWEEPCDDYTARARACCVRALRLVADEGLFGDRLAAITLLVASESGEHDAETVRQLNPFAVAERYEADVAAHDT